MIRPDAIPLILLKSTARLSRQDVDALFGKGYRFRGSENVRLVGPSGEIAVGITEDKTTRLELDRLDATIINQTRTLPSPPGRGAGGEGLHNDIAGPNGRATTRVAPTEMKIDVVGPKGKLRNVSAHVLPRTLTLPRSLHRVWGLSADSTIAIQVGSIILTDVIVHDGQSAGLHLDRTDLASSGINLQATAILRRDLKAANPQALAEAGIPKKLITENDVRQARRKGKKIAVQPGQLITPAARSLGKELGVLES